MSVGLWMILLAGAALAVLAPMLSPMLPLAGAVGFKPGGLRFGYFTDRVLLALGPVVVLGMGVWLLTRSEPTVALTEGQRRRRWWLRALAWMPLAALCVFQVATLTQLLATLPRRVDRGEYYYDHANRRLMQPERPIYVERGSSHPATATGIILWQVAYRGGWLADGLLTVGSAALPLLLFGHLRTLARRTGHARLVEHCGIVAWGLSGTLLLIAALAGAGYVRSLGVGETWVRRSPEYTWLLSVGTAAWLVFAGWAVLTLARAARAFWITGRERRALWRESDRSDTG